MLAIRGIRGSSRVNCNCTDSTDCSSASTAPRIRTRTAWRHAWRDQLTPRAQNRAVPPLGTIREIASQIRAIAVQPAVDRSSASRARCVGG